MPECPSARAPQQRSSDGLWSVAQRARVGRGPWAVGGRQEAAAPRRGPAAARSKLHHRALPSAQDASALQLRPRRRPPLPTCLLLTCITLAILRRRADPRSYQGVARCSVLVFCKSRWLVEPQPPATPVGAREPAPPPGVQNTPLTNPRGRHPRTTRSPVNPTTPPSASSPPPLPLRPPYNSTTFAVAVRAQSSSPSPPKRASSHTHSLALGAPPVSVASPADRLADRPATQPSLTGAPTVPLSTITPSIHSTCVCVASAQATLHHDLRLLLPLMALLPARHAGARRRHALVVRACLYQG